MGKGNFYVLTKSKNIKHGRACAWRGNKLVLASRRTKRVAGIWNNESRIAVIDLSGITHEFVIPEGLRIQGEAMVAFVDYK